MFHGMMLELSLVTARYNGQYSAHGVQELLNLLQGLGSLLRHQISATHSKRVLFPYNDPRHVNFSTHKVSVLCLLAYCHPTCVLIVNVRYYSISLAYF